MKRVFDGAEVIKVLWEKSGVFFVRRQKFCDVRSRKEENRMFEQLVGAKEQEKVHSQKFKN